MDRPGCAAPVLMLMQTPPEVTQVNGARIAVIALSIRDAAVFHRPVVALIERRTEFIGAWIAVVAISRDVTAASHGGVNALVRVRLTHSLRARLSIVTALLGRQTTPGNR